MEQTTTASARIRQRLDHPVIDGDGHFIEPRPLFADFVADHGRADLVATAPTFTVDPWKSWRAIPAEERRRQRTLAPSFWIAPGEAEYWATVTTPARYHERLWEAGIDFSVLYPSLGLGMLGIEDDETRVTLCRLFNQYVAEEYGPYRDRFAPAAVVPMHTPDEAVRSMEHAVALGFKVALIPSYVRRPVEADPTGRARWLDTYGIDSAHDYDPVWAKAIELRLPLACHSVGMGFSDRASISNYMYNHIGHFAAAGEALAKSLFFGGVTRRFPRLRVALLEGGVVVGVRLYGDLVARWKKRGPHVIQRINPERIDLDRLREILGPSDPRLARHSLEELVRSWGWPDDSDRDDFALTGVESVEDIRDAFCTNFFWGCEADDPLIGVAFDPRVTPLGARVPAIMGSDIAHWDVPEFSEPLEEAYELVENGILDEDAFRDFVFTNPLRCYADLNPDFFTGTAIEGDLAKLSSRVASSPA